METLIKILEGIRADLDFDKEEKLMDEGILDSFDVITILSEVNDAFGISINVGDLSPENFNSAKAIWALVQKYCR